MNRGYLAERDAVKWSRETNDRGGRERIGEKRAAVRKNERKNRTI